MHPLSHLRPRKSLGQNFLRDGNISRKIVAAAGPRPEDVVLEIGPGEGALTPYLASACRRLILVDVDERVVQRMKEMVPQAVMIHGDFLELDIEAMATREGKPLKVVGNIPYNLTTPILFHLLDHRARVSDATLMMQKEVAQRLVAVPGTRDYGILSVSFQMFADIDVLFTVSRNAFYPKPEVESSVVRLTMRESARYNVDDESRFRLLMRSLFGKRRKMLRNSLKYFCDEHGYNVPEAVDLTRRPEELTLAELAHLSNILLPTSRTA